MLRPVLVLAALLSTVPVSATPRLRFTVSETANLTYQLDCLSNRIRCARGPFPFDARRIEVENKLRIAELSATLVRGLKAREAHDATFVERIVRPGGAPAWIFVTDTPAQMEPLVAGFLAKEKK